MANPPPATTSLPAAALVPTAGADDASDQSFFNKRINICLDDTNFLLWKQQVTLMMRGHGLEDYLTGAIVPPVKPLAGADGELIINPAFKSYYKQDSSLASWLLTTVSSDILPQLVGAETTSSIWNMILGLYSKLSTTRIMHLHCRLRSIKKTDLTMRAYTTQIKEVCDLLASCGHLVSSVEHIATLLNGLPPEYDPFVAVISASREPYTVEGAVSILLDAESRIADPLRMPVGIHNTYYANQSSSPSTPSRATTPRYTGGRFRGRPPVQCQLCGKLGHLVDRCWHRFDKAFKGVSGPDPITTQANTASFTDSVEVAYDPCIAVPPTTIDSGPPVPNPEDVDLNNLVANIPSSSSVTWTPDSGATHHVTSSSSTMFSSSPYYG